MSPQLRDTRCATRSAAALGLDARRGAHVVHPHARRTEHARGQRTRSAGSRPTATASARRALRRRGARAARSRGGTGHAARRSLAAARRPVDQPARACRTTPTFAVVDVLGADGARIGTIANVSIHPVALGPECLAVSSDWVGPFRAELERRAGGTAVLLSGAIGDVNPHHVHRQDNDCARRRFRRGRATRPRRRRGASTRCSATAEPVAVDGPDSRSRTASIDVTLGDDAAHRPAARRRTVPVELVEWTIGPVRLVSVPGEAFHALGRAIEERGDGGATCSLAGLAPEWHGYLPVAVPRRLRGVDELRARRRRQLAQALVALDPS